MRAIAARYLEIGCAVITPDQKRMELLERILTDEECFSIEQLAINGQDLAGLGFTGPQLGACLYTLLDQVIMGETKNTLTALKNAASRQKEDR